MPSFRRQLAVAIVLAAASRGGERQPLDPDFPAVAAEQEVAAWRFADPASAWPALNQCTVSASGGVMRILSTGPDPYLRIPVPPVAGPVEIRWRMRTRARGPAEIFWTTADPAAGYRSVRVPTPADGEWHEHAAVVPERGLVTSLRLDPATAAGEIEVAEARAIRRVLHPLQFERLEADGGRVRGALRNISGEPLAFELGGRGYRCEAGGTAEFELPAPSGRAFPSVRVEARAEGFPPLARTLYLHRPEAPLDSVDFGNSNVLARVARDGSGARLLWKGRLAAVVAPLAQAGGEAVALRVVRERDGVELAGGPAERLALRVEGDEVRIELAAREPVTGPALRAVGALEQGLLAGVEYLEQGEASSSTLDIERTERIRYEPDPMLLTMPLAAFVTPEASLALLWDDPAATQPVFATPNRYDATADHLVALKGRALRLRVRLGDGFAAGGRLEAAILWAARSRGLPPPPPAPRSPEAQRQLTVLALTNTMRDAGGWFHARWAGSKSAPFADQASTLWRLTGEIPDLPRLERAGSHVRSDAIWLVSGRAKEWMGHIREQAAAARREQKPDGSFRYDGPYRRGHFEDTASGLCALRALPLLEAARYLGDAESFAAAERALAFLRRFRTPRGAQVWEMPMHTPDLYAAAVAVRACVLAFEETGKREYLDDARRWAVTGLPFVYQWDVKPVMRYATTGVLGATDWTGVVWIGLPVQWCGTVYAYALTDLAPHDPSVDWRRVAEGITVATEQMQYPDGPYAGAFPDSFNLGAQQRLEAAVNPCVPAALRLRLEGRLDGLAVAAAAGRRVVAPFPVTLRDGRAAVEARAGVRYQLLVDGTRIVDVTSKGRDDIPLDP